jgi:hypothetical protein
MKFFEVKNNLSTNKLCKKINSKIKKYSFCLVKNFNNFHDQKELLKIVKSRYKFKNDIRISGKRKIGDKDYQRVDLGDAYKNTRFMRIITFSEWNKNNKKFFKLINPIIKLRNELSKINKIGLFYPNVKKIKFKKEKNNFYLGDFVRMIQYPTGGGFLVKHNDYDEQYGKGVIAALLPLTVKTTNKHKSLFSTYEKGGLYFIYKGKKIIIDDYVENGDLILFDAKIDHGVNTIDPHKKINFSKLSGRLTLNFSVASFYK